MHVLVIPSWYPSPGREANGVFFREQAIALRRSGLKVGVIAVIHRLPRSVAQWRQVFGKREESDNGVHTICVVGIDWFRWFPMLSRKLWLYRGKKLYRYYEKKHGQPSVIHAHCILNAGFLAKSISENAKLPFVITEHTTMFLRKKLQPHKVVQLKKVLLSASRCFAVSPNFAKSLSVIFGERIVWDVMPNIVDSRFFEATRMSSRSKEEKPFVFLSVAILSKVKRMDDLLQAFALAFRGKKSVVLGIGGSGQELENLRALTRPLGITSQVTFFGSLTRVDVVQKMRQAHVFVLASEVETFGVVVAEALALGVPTVATLSGGPETIIQDHDGMLVPVGDVEALAHAMKKIKRNYVQYDPEKIRDACAARYSEKAVVTKLVRVYEDVCRCV